MTKRSKYLFETLSAQAVPTGNNNFVSQARAGNISAGGNIGGGVVGGNTGGGGGGVTANDNAEGRGVKGRTPAPANTDRSPAPGTITNRSGNVIDDKKRYIDSFSRTQSTGTGETPPRRGGQIDPDYNLIPKDDGRLNPDKPKDDKPKDEKPDTPPKDEKKGDQGGGGYSGGGGGGGYSGGRLPEITQTENIPQNIQQTAQAETTNYVPIIIGAAAAAIILILLLKK